MKNLYDKLMKTFSMQYIDTGDTLEYNCPTCKETVRCQVSLGKEGTKAVLYNITKIMTGGTDEEL